MERSLFILLSVGNYSSSSNGFELTAATWQGQGKAPSEFPLTCYCS